MLCLKGGWAWRSKATLNSVTLVVNTCLEKAWIIKPTCSLQFQIIADSCKSCKHSRTSESRAEVKVRSQNPAGTSACWAQRNFSPSADECENMFFSVVVWTQCCDVWRFWFMEWSKNETWTAHIWTADSCQISSFSRCLCGKFHFPGYEIKCSKMTETWKPDTSADNPSLSSHTLPTTHPVLPWQSTSSRPPLPHHHHSHQHHHGNYTVCCHDSVFMGFRKDSIRMEWAGWFVWHNVKLLKPGTASSKVQFLDFPFAHWPICHSHIAATIFLSVSKNSENSCGI